MAAEFVDALKGYEYYLKMRGKVSMEQINEYLITQGRKTIQVRTYGHYGKLLHNGFQSYIPINKFDVFQSLGKLQMAADRRLYSREAIDRPIEISVDEKEWVKAIILDRSIVGFAIQTQKKFPIAKNAQIWVKLDGYQNIPVIAVWKKHQEDNTTRLGVRAFEFIAKYELTDKDIENQRLTGILKISRETEEEISWDNIYRVLGKTNELIDSISALIYSLNEVMNSSIKLASPILSSIKFGSPGDVQIKIDFGVAELLKIIIGTFQFWGTEKKKARAEVRRLDLENSKLEIEIMRNAINLRKEADEIGLAVTQETISELSEPIKKIFKVKKLPNEVFSTGSLEIGILKERVFPAIAELTAGDDTDFDVSVKVGE